MATDCQLGVFSYTSAVSRISTAPLIIHTELIQCPDLTIANGNVSIIPPGGQFTSRTIYTCNEGFALMRDGNRICQENSAWNGTDPECGKV